MKTGLIYNWIIFVYLLIVALLTLNGNIAYGNGLGDFAYLIANGILACTQLAVIIVLIRKQQGNDKPTVFYFCGTIFILAAVFLSWKFTLGRGPEYSWNGNIFYANPF